MNLQCNSVRLVSQELIEIKLRDPNARGGDDNPNRILLQRPVAEADRWIVGAYYPVAIGGDGPVPMKLESAP